MKKNLFIVAAVALMAMVSCNKEEINNNGAEQASDIVFVAEFDQEADTKIALGDLVDGIRKTTWVAGDEIKINGTVFSAKEAGDVTEFTTTSSFTEVATYRAVYPAASYISTTAVDIPATQNGTFASASIAVAESATTSLKFNNLVTILKFQVPVDCSKVTFESTASIAGGITVNYNDGVMTPNYAGVTQPNKTINVTGKFVPGTDYYVAVKPDTHTFTVKIDGNVSKVSTKAVKVERSQILNMGVLPEPQPVVLVGDFNSWVAGANPTIKESSYYVIKNVVVSKESEFKIIIDDSYYRMINGAPTKGKWQSLYKIEGNPKLKVGTYDIYVDKANYFVCYVDSGTTLPVFNTQSNREYYIVMQHTWSDWDYRLYCWGGNQWGATNTWPGIYAEGSFVPTHDQTHEYKYWKVDSSKNGKNINLLFTDDNNGKIQQTHDWNNLSLTSDCFFAMDYWDSSASKAKIKSLQQSSFR